MRVTLCQKVGFCTGAWVIAITLCVTHTFITHAALLPWIYMALALGCVGSVWLMAYRVRRDILWELRRMEERRDRAEGADHLTLVH